MKHDRICLTNLVDISAGPFRFDNKRVDMYDVESVVADLRRYLGRLPNHFVVDMIRDKSGKYDYRVAIYIDKKTFTRKC